MFNKTIKIQAVVRLQATAAAAAAHSQQKHSFQLITIKISAVFLNWNWILKQIAQRRRRQDTAKLWERNVTIYNHIGISCVYNSHHTVSWACVELIVYIFFLRKETMNESVHFESTKSIQPMAFPSSQLNFSPNCVYSQQEWTYH